MSFLDPFGLLGPRSPSGERAPGGDRTREWLEATSQWTDPRWWLAQAPGGRTAQRTLLGLAGGLAERFTGRELEVRAGGRTIRGVLDNVRIDAGTVASAMTGSDLPPVELRLSAHDVDVDGVTLQSVSVVAQNVELSLGLRAAVSMGPIDVEVRIADEQATAWLRRWVPAQWAIEPTGTGRVVASWQAHPVELELEPLLRDAGVDVELRAVTWHGFRVPVPPWLRLARRRPLPPLPAGMELVEAWQAHGAINARIRLPHHRQRLRLDRLRDAVAHDDATLELDDGGSD